MAARTPLIVTLYVLCLSCVFVPFCLPLSDFILYSIAYANIHVLGQKMGLKLHVNVEVVLVLQYQSARFCRPVLVKQ